MVLRVDIEAPPPHVAHARLAARFGTTFILESGGGPDRLSRHSLVGWDPLGTVEHGPGGLRVTGALPVASRGQPPLDYLRRLLQFYRTDDRDTPFVGGLVGAVGAGFARDLEPTLETRAPETWPRLLFGLYLDTLLYDHQEGTTQYVSRGPDRRRDLSALGDDAPRAPLRIGPLQERSGRAAFVERARAARELVRAGECFQIVLSRASEASCEGDLGQAYDALRASARVPYLFHLRFAGPPARELLGASPECLVRVEGDLAETFPIAGTRPLTGNAAQDARLGEDLKSDPKENAEHAMLVDLARNDLSRVSRPGTVRVTRLRTLQRFPGVQHLVSRVEGRLSPGRDALDALAAVFPAGTVSGAPKVRALEHIARLEEDDRGPYGGAVCYASFQGDLQSCITIRSLSAQGGRLRVQAGAGIVLASDPEREYEETRQKGAALRAALRPFSAPEAVA